MEAKFNLTITGKAQGEWQGQVERPGDSPRTFESVLELIKIINQELENEKL